MSCLLLVSSATLTSCGEDLQDTNQYQGGVTLNAYGPNRENIRAAVEKMTGRSEFRGTADDTVFCGRWDTRL